jgi:hypothetical protein
MSKTEKQFKGFEGKINKAFSGIAGGMGLNLGKLGKFALIGMAAKELYKFGKASVEVAADLVETQNVVDVTFGSMAGAVNEFSSNAIKQFGLSELSAKKYASTMGAMLKSSGIRGSAVKDMSIELAKLSADMASFYNLDNDAAFQKIMSGMSGMTQPLKELGINMNIANLEAYALSQGIKKKWQNMSQAEQTLIRYNYLLSVTSDSQGDFARNADTWSNQVKILRMQWEQFMSLIGKALIEILLPIVKFLNKVLEALILITKEIGKIYTMVTGKNVAVEANNNISSSADDATDSEIDLSKGIDKGAKSAKKALAPFDELNILQNSLGSGDGGTIGLGNFKTDINTNQVTDGLSSVFKKAEEDGNRFYLWFTDKWNNLKQMLSVPIMVPAPIFASIPVPIYHPEWGLTPPLVPAPVFQPIPNPVYNPNWSLEVPKVEKPVFEPIPNPVYRPNWGLETPKLSPIVIPPLESTEYKKSLEGTKTETTKSWNSISEEVKQSSEKQNIGLKGAWDTREKNYSVHKENMGSITSSTSDVVVKNTNEGLTKVGINTNNTITTTQSNWQTWGKSLGGISAETSDVFNANLNEGYKVGNVNTVNFANAQIKATAGMGNGMVKASAETVEAMNDNYNSGFSSIYEGFKNLMKSMGEKVTGFFSANKKLILTSAIVGGAVIGAGALALAAPAAIPYIGTALGGLASIPALAKGGITNGPTMALIGDNPGGKEVVSPLDGLLDMITDAVSTTNNQSNGDTTIIVKIGEDTLTEKVVSNINRQNRISGKTVITV